MSKRRNDDKIEFYRAKVRRLEKRERFRRLIIVSSSDDEESSGNEYSHDPPVAATPDPSPDRDAAPRAAQDAAMPQDAVAPQDAAAPPLGAPAAPDALEEPILDPELLLALGDAMDDSPAFGEKIHTTLAQRWQPLLKKGLPKETKDKLLKEYLIPENCSLLQAPKLNAEISAAVADSVRIRDKKMEIAQQQLGAGVAAVNRGMTVLITGDDKPQAIKFLSDGCRLLSDLHFVDSQARIKLLTTSLSRPFLNVIQDSERDETLFGVKLPEKIKASKAIEKQSSQIKKPTTTGQRSSSTATPSTSRASYQGNWAGPSRYPTSREGRAAARRAPPASRRAPSAPSTRAAGQPRPRAPAQHQ